MKQLFHRCGQAVKTRYRAFLTHISSDPGRKRFRISGAVSLACLLVFLIERYPIFYALFWAVLLGTMVFLAQEREQKVLPRLLWLLGPLLSFLSVEYMIGNIEYFPFVCQLSALEIFLNLIWYYMIAGAIHLICRRRRLSAVISAVLFLAIGMAECYFYAFRGRVIFPADIVAVNTALKVVSEYSFWPSLQQWMGILTCAAYVAALFLLSKKHRWRRPKWFLVLPATVLCVGYICIFFLTPFLSWTGFEGKLWTSLWRTRENGVLLNFTINLRYSTVEEPEGYADRILSLTNARKSEKAELSEGQTRPNIIVIMNESLSDLSVLGVETNEPCMPFLNSLTKNTIKGNTYVSVFAGHTANSEFEFLTGNSISFLPVGTVAYQMFAREGDYSLVRQLSDLGYDSVAMHPYDAFGWNRLSVYRYYGFDEMHFIEDFQNVVNVRDYCSDRSNYENLIRTFEDHRAANQDTPLFLFNVTMQNHGDYWPRWDGLEKTVWLTGDLEDDYEGVDMYLSLVRESDNAFKELIEYFQQVEEPTVIVMFGDHQPGLPNEFYEDLFGQHKDTLEAEQAMCMYQIPYVIWANYDIGGKEYGDFSLNYLSTVLVDALGFPKTGYQQFLSEAMQTLPIITRNFYRTASGLCSADTSVLPQEAQNILSEYAILQYNGIKGKENRYDGFFNLTP